MYPAFPQLLPRDLTTIPAWSALSGTAQALLLACHTQLQYEDALRQLHGGLMPPTFGPGLNERSGLLAHDARESASRGVPFTGWHTETVR